MRSPMYLARLNERIHFEYSLANILSRYGISELVVTCFVEGDEFSPQGLFSYVVCAHTRYRGFQSAGFNDELCNLSIRNGGLIRHLYWDLIYDQKGMYVQYRGPNACRRVRYAKIGTAIPDLHKLCRRGFK